MKNARALIAKIESTLNTDIAEAAAKRDLNKMVLALTESVKDLVQIVHDLVDAADVEKPAPKAVAKPKVAVKKAAPKRVQKQPIAPK